MTDLYDLVIRGGQIVDGTGGEPFVADVAIAAGRVAEVGRVSGRGAEEIDARGAIVTPASSTFTPTSMAMSPGNPGSIQSPATGSPPR
jgi:hypothetical protein